MITKFVQLPIGARFEFRGRRYEKLALSMARDEDRFGNIFHDDTEVSVHPDDAGRTARGCPSRSSHDNTIAHEPIVTRQAIQAAAAGTAARRGTQIT